MKKMFMILSVYSSFWSCSGGSLIDCVYIKKKLKTFQETCDNLKKKTLKPENRKFLLFTFY